MSERMTGHQTLDIANVLATYDQGYSQKARQGVKTFDIANDLVKLQSMAKQGVKTYDLANGLGIVF